MIEFILGTLIVLGLILWTTYFYQQGFEDGVKENEYGVCFDMTEKSSCSHSKTLAIYTHQNSGFRIVKGLRCCAECRTVMRLETW